MSPGHYIIDDDGEPQPVQVYVDGKLQRDALLAWAQWFETGDRVVLRTTIGYEGGTVSTIFLALDHDYSGVGPPVLWETLVFDGPFDSHMWRASTRLAALQQHQLAVALIELYRAAPRKTKKALQCYAQRWSTWPRRVPARRRLQRAFARIGA